MEPIKRLPPNPILKSLKKIKRYLYAVVKKLKHHRIVMEPTKSSYTLFCPIFDLAQKIGIQEKMAICKDSLLLPCQTTTGLVTNLQTLP